MNYYLPPMEIYKQPWAMLCDAYESNGLIDRTRTLDLGFDYSVISEIPNDPFTNLSFKDVVSDRVENIIQQAINPIMLLWSGGIDSTVVFCALLDAGIAFSVAYSSNSIEEYPWLYDKLTKQYFGDQINLIKVEDYYINELQKDFHIVTGNIGDQIIGTANHYTIDGDIRPKQLEPYKDVLPTYLLTLFEKTIDAFPIELKDYADWLWWFNFTLKYQPQQMLHAEYLMFDVANTNSYSAFFDSELFQQWAMSNRESNKDWIRNNVKSRYKQVYKEYIFAELRDRNYLENKLKKGSMNGTIRKGRYRHIYIVNENNAMKIVEY